MRAPQHGFTLIELVVVILILGILAATALPRFMAAQVDARIAKAQGIYGAVRSAAVLARARCELDLARNLTGVNQCGNATSVVSMEGGLISMLHRYPDSTAFVDTSKPAGIALAAQLDATNDNLTVTQTGAAQTTTIDVGGATTPSKCRISYTPAAADGAVPTITLDTSGC